MFHVIYACFNNKLNMSNKHLTNSLLFLIKSHIQWYSKKQCCNWFWQYTSLIIKTLLKP